MRLPRRLRLLAMTVGICVVIYVAICVVSNALWQLFNNAAKRHIALKISRAQVYRNEVISLRKLACAKY